MAIASSGFWGTITLVDNGGNQSTLTYHLRGADFTFATANMVAILPALELITNSVVGAWSVGERFREESLSFPPAGVQNEDKASISALLTTLGKKANIQIPAPVIGMFTAATGPGANVVDPLDIDMLAYLDLFKAGAEATISDGEDLALYLSGKRISTKNQHG